MGEVGQLLNTLKSVKKCQKYGTIYILCLLSISDRAKMSSLLSGDSKTRLDDMDPPRLLHACSLHQGGVLVTGGKVLREFTSSGMQLAKAYLCLESQTENICNIAQADAIAC